MSMNKKKRIIFYSILFLIGAFVVVNQLSNAGILLAPIDSPNVAENPCDEESIRRVLKILGYILLIVKVAVPLIIIGFATFDLFKSVIDKDEKSFGKQIKQVIIRIVAGMVIFFLPNLINAVFSLSDALNIIDDDQYKTCASCLLEPTNNTRCRVD